MLKYRNVLLAVGLAACLALSACIAEAAPDDQIAQSFGTLTDQQKAELIKQAATMQVQNANNPFHSSKTAASTVDSVDKYTDVAIKVTRALASGAKEVGVAVNSFLDTPAGKWTLAIIVYKTMGSDIMHFLAAIVVFTSGVGFLTIMGQRLRTATIKYDRERKNWFGNYPVISKEYTKYTNEDVWFLTVWGAIILIVTTLLIITVT